MTLTRAQIVESLFAKNLFTKGESAQIVETLFDLIKQSLQIAASKNRRLLFRKEGSG